MKPEKFKGAFLLMRIVAVGCCLFILFAISLPDGALAQIPRSDRCPTSAENPGGFNCDEVNAINCDEINNRIIFDYRSWGIGIHRGCRDCGLPPINPFELPAWFQCVGERIDCERLREQQIRFGEPIRAWIEASKDSAARSGVRPIPPDIRDKLKHLFPPNILDKARYTTDTGAVGTLQYFREEFGMTGAITLDNIIVFRDGRDATSVCLWAHELEHVAQYDRLGVDGFAQAYVDQTCILPGNNGGLGYDSDRCQVERGADRKRCLLNVNKGFFNCCTLRIGASLNHVLQNGVFNSPVEFRAFDSITVGPNITVQTGGDVVLRAGNRIIFNPGVRVEPGGNLLAEIIPSLARSCQSNAPAPTDDNQSQSTVDGAQNVVYVDCSKTGPGLGTLEHPFASIGEALNRAPGAKVVITGGHCDMGTK